MSTQSELNYEITLEKVLDVTKNINKQLESNKELLTNIRKDVDILQQNSLLLEQKKC